MIYLSMRDNYSICKALNFNWAEGGFRVSQLTIIRATQSINAVAWGINQLNVVVDEMLLIRSSATVTFTNPTVLTRFTKSKNYVCIFKKSSANDRPLSVNFERCILSYEKNLLHISSKYGVIGSVRKCHCIQIIFQTLNS